MEHRGVEPRLAALRLLGQVRNSRLPSLPFGRLLCSLGFRLAFAYGEQPTGLIFGSFPTGGPRFLPFAQWSFKSLGAGLALPFALTNSGRFCLSANGSASSIVATPRWGDCSFSDDLTSDEISATGCPKRFVHWADASFVCPAFAVTSAKALTACAWQALPKSKIWTPAHLQCCALEIRGSISPVRTQKKNHP